MGRENTKVIHIGNKVIGGGNPIMIQSMTNTRTEDVEATVKQIQDLTFAGCDIVRCTVPTLEAAKALSEIKKKVSIPIVADIHFDYKMAIAAMENGADKIRINPGNIGSRENLAKVVAVAKERNIPIRVGVNFDARSSASISAPAARKLSRWFAISAGSILGTRSLTSASAFSNELRQAEIWLRESNSDMRLFKSILAPAARNFS